MMRKMHSHFHFFTFTNNHNNEYIYLHSKNLKNTEKVYSQEMSYCVIIK